MNDTEQTFKCMWFIKDLQKQSNKDFFTRLLNSCQHLTKNKFTILMHIEEILKQPIILNPHTKLSFSFYGIPPKKILQTETNLPYLNSIDFNQDSYFLHKI